MVHNGAFWLRNKPFIHSFWCFSDIKTHGTQGPKTWQGPPAASATLPVEVSPAPPRHLRGTAAAAAWGPFYWAGWKSGSQKKPGLHWASCFMNAGNWTVQRFAVAGNSWNVGCCLASPVVKSRFSPTDRAPANWEAWKITRIQISLSSILAKH